MPLSSLRPLLCSALLLLAPALSPAAPGELDFTFGIGGRVTTDLGGFDDEAFCVALQSDGKILVAGASVTDGNGGPSDRGFALVRYNTDGTLDEGFGSGGTVTTRIGSGGAYGNSVAVQSDGMIVVVGYVQAGVFDNDIALIRYTSTGALDMSFGSGGKVTTSIAGVDGGNSVVLQSDGRIVVAGSAGTINNGDFAVVRYTNTGELDPSFGSGGKVTTPISGSNDFGNSAALQGDGKIVVAGSADGDFAVVRYTDTGALDTSFGDGGKVITPIGSGSAFGRSMALQSDGKIVVAGEAQMGGNDDFAVVRYTDTGVLDSGFGVGGKVITPIGSGDDRAASVALQSDGKIIVGGWAGEGSDFDYVLVRYNPDGTPDDGFGSGGKAALGLASRVGYNGGMAVQNDGKIVVAAISEDRRLGPSFFRYDFGLTRCYSGEPAPALPPPVFDTETTSVAGTDFRDFRSPAIDGGQVGGLATVAGDTGRSEVAAYAGADGALLVERGGTDPEGSTYTALGDPVFGGEAVGFAGTARLAPATALRDWQMDARLGSGRMPGVRPGGRLAALYSRLSAAAGLRRLAVQTGPAPGTDGQFASFPSFGLPRDRGGLIFTARLHRGRTVTRRNDFGIWRETPAGGLSELLLRIGRPLGGSLAPAGALRARGADDPRTVEKLSLLGPVTNATDQRRSFAPDGGVAALADFDDGTEGVVFVAADGSIDVPVDSQTPVPDEAGAAVAGIEFTAFSQPATASSGRFALAAALRAVQQNAPPPPSHAIFANRDGTLRRVLNSDGQVPGREGLRFTGLGQPLLGERGMIGLIAALTGQRVPPTARKAIVLVEDKVKAVAARLGEQASGFDEGAVYRRFISVVVTDSDPARLVFTGTVGGPGVTAGSSLGLWSVSPAAGVNLLLRTGQEIDIGGALLKVRAFDALKAPKKSMGQGRSTDADGFVTAKATLSDGRKGVLRIPLP